MEGKSKYSYGWLAMSVAYVVAIVVTGSLVWAWLYLFMYCPD